MKNKTPVIIAVVAVVVIAVIAAVAIIVNNDNGGQPSGNDNSQVETNDDSNKNNNTEPQAISIVGKWKYDDPDLGDSFIYTFNADGTGNYTASGNFTYKIDGNNISIIYDASGATFDTVFEVNGDRLNMIDSIGNDTFYKRVK